MSYRNLYVNHFNAVQILYEWNHDTSAFGRSFRRSSRDILISGKAYMVNRRRGMQSASE